MTLFAADSIQEKIQMSKGISLKWRKRPCCNLILYSVYKMLRIVFVAVWFYYIPLIVVITTNVVPTFKHW